VLAGAEAGEGGADEAEGAVEVYFELVFGFLVAGS